MDTNTSIMDTIINQAEIELATRYARGEMTFKELRKLTDDLSRRYEGPVCYTLNGAVLRMREMTPTASLVIRAARLMGAVLPKVERTWISWDGRWRMPKRQARQERRMVEAFEAARDYLASLDA